MVERITITGRIVDPHREMTLQALHQLRALFRREGRTVFTPQQAAKPLPDLLKIDYATLERRILEGSL